MGGNSHSSAAGKCFLGMIFPFVESENENEIKMKRKRNENRKL